MNVEKLPRWVLIAGFSGFMLLGGFMLKGAFADLDATKAKATKTELAVIELSRTVEKIDNRQESFNEKYDRNQEENQRVFRQILAAVKT